MLDAPAPVADPLRTDPAPRAAGDKRMRRRDSSFSVHLPEGRDEPPEGRRREAPERPASGQPPERARQDRTAARQVERAPETKPERACSEYGDEASTTLTLEANTASSDADAIKGDLAIVLGTEATATVPTPDQAEKAPADGAPALATPANPPPPLPTLLAFPSPLPPTSNAGEEPKLSRGAGLGLPISATAQIQARDATAAAISPDGAEPPSFEQAEHAAETPAKPTPGDAPRPAAAEFNATGVQAMREDVSATPPLSAPPPLAAPAAHAASADAGRLQPVPVSPPTPIQMAPLSIGLMALDGAREFQIRLDPPELGRVDVKLTIADNGRVEASLVVDRVETLAMLQRDARTLERAFDQAGLTADSGSLSFSLRQDDASRHQPGERQPGSERARTEGG